MKAITIQQPFAELIAQGRKRYEFRAWKTAYRGEILIHAAKKVDREAAVRFGESAAYDTGCIVAKAVLSDCIWVDASFRKKLKREDAKVYEGILRDEAWKGYAFLLEDVCRTECVPMKGMLGLWEYDGGY